MQKFIDRKKKEQARLNALKDIHKSEFAAVYGRWRVGKTLLIRHVFQNEFTFQVTGIANIDKHQQLFAFATAFSKSRIA